MSWEALEKPPRLVGGGIRWPLFGAPGARRRWGLEEIRTSFSSLQSGPNHALRTGKEGTGFGEPPPVSLHWPLSPAEPVGKGKDLELSDLEDFDPWRENPRVRAEASFQPLDGGLDRIPTGPEGPSAPGRRLRAPSGCPWPPGAGPLWTKTWRAQAASGARRPGRSSRRARGAARRPASPSWASLPLGRRPASRPSRASGPWHTRPPRPPPPPSARPEFPSCMLKRQGPPQALRPPPRRPLLLARGPGPAGALDEHQDSPVTSLRNWVDRGPSTTPSSGTAL